MFRNSIFQNRNIDNFNMNNDSSIPINYDNSKNYKMKEEDYYKKRPK